MQKATFTVLGAHRFRYTLDFENLEEQQRLERDPGSRVRAGTRAIQRPQKPAINASILMDVASNPEVMEPSKDSMGETMWLQLASQHLVEDIVNRLEDAKTKLQGKTVPEDEKRTDFWISDPYFVNEWLPSMMLTLEHSRIVDYDQQAIMRRSTIIKILSESCKQLKTLDLENMFLGTGDCVKMPSMLRLTWRCVKVSGVALQDINNRMPKLQTLALLGVFGVKRGSLTFADMKVLCLGLSTPAKDIEMKLPKLEKLQLKMQCPQKLIIEPSILKYVSFNLEVLKPSKVDLKSMAGLQELLSGATSFTTVSSPMLKKLFLDIPCMALGEDGRFLGLLKDVPLVLPTFSMLHKCGMPKLQTLALLGVFGVERGSLTFADMKVRCLGLHTPAKDIEMKLPKLEKLQLKMQCPQKLIIEPSILKYVSFDLEVLKPSKLDLRSMAGLQELLSGATSFTTVSSPMLKKLFLDIPCMALGEDGRFLGLLKDVPLMFPTSSMLHKCGIQGVLNIGPGLWYCMETSMKTLATGEVAFDKSRNPADDTTEFRPCNQGFADVAETFSIVVDNLCACI